MATGLTETRFSHAIGPTLANRSVDFAETRYDVVVQAWIPGAALVSRPIDIDAAVTVVAPTFPT